MTIFDYFSPKNREKRAMKRTQERYDRASQKRRNTIEMAIAKKQKTLKQKATFYQKTGYFYRIQGKHAIRVSHDPYYYYGYREHEAPPHLKGEQLRRALAA